MHEYQNKGLTEFAICNWLILKGEHSCASGATHKVISRKGLSRMAGKTGCQKLREDKQIFG
jgi:hypothetical protein